MVFCLRQTSPRPENDCSRGEGSRVDLSHGLSYRLLSCNQGLKYLAFSLLPITRFNLLIDAPRGNSCLFLWSSMLRFPFLLPDAAITQSA
jgi:hypothetical protein